VIARLWPRWPCGAEWRRWLGAALLRALPLIIAALALGAVVARDALAAARQVQTAEQQVGGLLQGDLGPATRGRVQAAGHTLDEASGRLQRDRLLLSPATPLLRLLGWVPLVGQPLAEAPDLIAAGAEVASGGARLAHGLAPLLAETNAPPDAATPPAQRLVAALDAGAPALRHGDKDLQAALARRARLHPEVYRGPFHGLRSQLAAFDASVPGVARQARALALLPAAATALLGFDGPRTYLVLGQDSAELRPTGGFIGSAGLITLERGRLAFQEYRSSYDFDAPNAAPLPAPAPLQQYLGTPVWSLRDANWSPDFPASARQVLAFLQRDLGITPDGVLAFDNDAVSALLAALGPLPVAGFAQPLTAQDWFDQTTQALITAPGSLLSQLQNANAAKGTGLSAVLKAVLASVNSAAGEQQTRALQALRVSARAGDLLLYTPEPPAAAWVQSAGAGGALTPPPAGDVLGAFDANLGYTKIGPYIHRSLQYEVWLGEDGRAQRAQLQLTYSNTATPAQVADPAKRLLGARWLPREGRFEAAPGLFGDYLRVLLPPGSALSSAGGLPDAPRVAQEAGYTSLAQFIPLGPQETQTLTFDLKPGFAPPAPDEYRLTLLKQPGVGQQSVRVSVHLPPGRTAQAVSASGVVQGQTVVWSLDLAGASTFELRLGGR